MALKLTAPKLLLLCAVAALLNLSGCKVLPQRPDRYQAIKPAKAFPPALLIAADGRKQTLKDFAGKVLIVNFWATWCAPCIKELPELDQLAKKLPEDRFALILVGEDIDSRSKEEARLRKLKIRRAPSYSDPGNTLRKALGVRGLPTTLVAGGNGRFAAKFEGPVAWNSQTMQNWLDAGAP